MTDQPSTPNTLQEAFNYTLTQVFNAYSPDGAVSIYPVDLYYPNVDKLGTENIADAGEARARMLIKGTVTSDMYGDAGYVDFYKNAGNWEFSMLSPKNAESEHFLDALAFAEDWISKQPAGTYEDPAFIEFAPLNMIALWIKGPKDVFIPVHEFGLKPTDPLRIDDKYLERVKAADTKQKIEYARMKKMYPGRDDFGG